MKKKTKTVRAHVTDTAEQVAHTLPKQGRGSIVSDVLGSYTGTAQDNEVPEQDADDL